MKSRLFLITASIFILAVTLGAVALAELKVQPDKENVVASRLIGTWVIDAQLTKRLEGAASLEGGDGKQTALVFVEDQTIPAQIPAKYNTFLAENQIFLAGTMTLRNEKFPFILISHKGNPHVLFFVPKDGDPYGDAESFNVMLAVAKDTLNDMLFIGGDFNNQPFSAYMREVVDKD